MIRPGWRSGDHVDEEPRHSMIGRKFGTFELVVIVLCAALGIAIYFM
jgi:hypothetical protein